MGLSLTEHVSRETIADLSVFNVHDGTILAYLNQVGYPSLEQLRTLIQERPTRLVLLEDAFKNRSFKALDELKTNVVQECSAYDVELWIA